jgi:hypothetical protein
MCRHWLLGAVGLQKVAGRGDHTPARARVEWIHPVLFLLGTYSRLPRRQPW